MNIQLSFESLTSSQIERRKALKQESLLKKVITVSESPRNFTTSSIASSKKTGYNQNQK